MPDKEPLLDRIARTRRQLRGEEAPPVTRAGDPPLITRPHDWPDEQPRGIDPTSMRALLEGALDERLPRVERLNAAAVLMRDLSALVYDFAGGDPPGEREEEDWGHPDRRGDGTPTHIPPDEPD